MRATLASNAGTGNGSWVEWVGGKTSFMARATFGGGSVKLQGLLPDGSTAFDVSSASLTAAGNINVEIPPGLYRAVNTTATAVYADLIRIPQ